MDENEQKFSLKKSWKLNITNVYYLILYHILNVALGIN